MGPSPMMSAQFSGQRILYVEVDSMYSIICIVIASMIRVRKKELVAIDASVPALVIISLAFLVIFSLHFSWSFFRVVVEWFSVCVRVFVSSYFCYVMSYF